MLPPAGTTGTPVRALRCNQLKLITEPNWTFSCLSLTRGIPRCRSPGAVVLWRGIAAGCLRPGSGTHWGGLLVCRKPDAAFEASGSSACCELQMIPSTKADGDCPTKAPLNNSADCDPNALSQTRLRNLLISQSSLSNCRQPSSTRLTSSPSVKALVRGVFLLTGVAGAGSGSVSTTCSSFGKLHPCACAIRSGLRR